MFGVSPYVCRACAHQLAASCKRHTTMSAHSAPMVVAFSCTAIHIGPSNGCCRQLHSFTHGGHKSTKFSR
jgi:hypothetical protein